MLMSSYHRTAAEVLEMDRRGTPAAASLGTT
jgi:hypothetical protein